MFPKHHVLFGILDNGQSQKPSNNTAAAVTKLHALGSRKNRATWQQEQRSVGEWRQLVIRSVTKLTTMCPADFPRGKGDEVLLEVYTS
jgi:hypothetical protein